MTLKVKVKVILNQWHLKTIVWTTSDSLWICESKRRTICNFTRPSLYLPLLICINFRALAWEGAYVYKLAFFFWLSPRTYHFLFEKQLDNRLAVLLTKYRTIVDFRTENECHQTTPLSRLPNLKLTVHHATLRSHAKAYITRLNRYSLPIHLLKNAA